MTKILYLTSSPRGEDSYSNRAAGDLIADIKRRDPAARVIHRDLAADPLPHIDADFGAATRGPNGPQTPAQRDGAARSDVLIDELLAADTIVISAGMINFGIPSTLKAWIDRIAVAGRTFRYTEAGPEGLAGGKKVVVASGRGGLHTGEPSDFQEPYLRQVFAFLGIDDVEFVRAEGVAYSPQHRSDAIAAARSAIPALVAPLRKAA